MLKLNMNPEKYIKTQARMLPIVRCLINGDWKDGGIAHIIVIRQHKTLHLTLGVFLVDLCCLGLKDTFFEFNIQPDELDNFIPDVDWEECEYTLAHNIIYGGIDYAEDFGFRPHKDFQVTKFLLEDDDDQIEFIDVEFGIEGMPCYAISPFDDPVKVKNTIATLERKAGPGNFTVISLNDFDEDVDDEDLDDEWEEDSEDEIIKMTTELNLSYDQAFRTPEEVENLMEYPIEQDYEITGDIIESKYNRFDSNEQELEYIRLHGLVIHEQEAELAIQQLKKAIAKWPGKALFYNLLQSAYATNNQDRESDSCIKEMFRLFPDYLFAKISYANMLIDEGKAEKALGVFRDKTNLNHLYPERRVFHFSEVASYYGTLCRYYTAIGDIDLADAYMHFLVKVDLVGLSGQTIVNLAMAELCTAKIRKLDEL